MMDGPIPPSSSRSMNHTTTTTTTTNSRSHHHHPPSSSSSSSSTLPTTASTSSISSASSAALFRPRRSDDWQQYRPIIEQLYVNNQLKLRDVKIIMEQKHGFVASYVLPFFFFFLFALFYSCILVFVSARKFNGLTLCSEKQYKDRLAAWHIRKNIKAKEVHVMIRKQQKRAARGKQTAFRVGGQEVDSKRISRFLRRYGSSWQNSRGGPKSPQTSRTSPEPGGFLISTHDCEE